GGFDDALLDEAVKVVTSSGMASTSGLQRRLRVGFTRAGRLVDMMEKAGIIGPLDGARPREILVDEDEAAEIIERLRGAG
ncbi:MAG: DNA translocase FtsK, partial [Synergistaceae bacterium]|nr:DNA translocase FtsK [Synergistaceae bacterium]